MSRRFPDMSKPAPAPWSAVDSLITAIMAAVICSGIAGGTLLMLLMYPHR